MLYNRIWLVRAIGPHLSNFDQSFQCASTSAKPPSVLSQTIILAFVAPASFLFLLCTLFLKVDASIFGNCRVKILMATGDNMNNLQSSQMLVNHQEIPPQYWPVLACYHAAPALLTSLQIHHPANIISAACLLILLVRPCVASPTTSFFCKSAF